MRAVIQRVTKASVTIDEVIRGKIGDGLVVLIVIEDADSEEDINWLSNKMVNMRICNDEEGVMNKSVSEIRRSISLISKST